MKHLVILSSLLLTMGFISVNLSAQTPGDKIDQALANHIVDLTTTKATCARPCNKSKSISCQPGTFCSNPNCGLRKRKSCTIIPGQGMNCSTGASRHCKRSSNINGTNCAGSATRCKVQTVIASASVTSAASEIAILTALNRVASNGGQRP